MDRDKENKETTIETLLSDNTDTAEANIRMDREFYGDEEIEHPEETTVPFINRNQS